VINKRCVGIEFVALTAVQYNSWDLLFCILYEVFLAFQYMLYIVYSPISL